MTLPHIDTLLYALREGAPLPTPESLLLLRAHPLPPTCELTHSRDKIDCEQSFRPIARQLIAQGYRWVESASRRYDYIIYLGTRARDENLYTFARATNLLNEGGTLLCAMPNELGAKRFEGHLRDLLGGSLESVSKYHSRAFWGRKSAGELDASLLDQWLALGGYHPVEGTPFFSTPGIFSSGRVDEGSALLTASVTTTFRGRGADLGAGAGVLSHWVLSGNPSISELFLVEAEALALEAARRCITPLSHPARLHFDWRDVASELQSNAAMTNLDWVVMNPPFHQGDRTSVELGERFITSAAQILRPGGDLYLVSNIHLPYEEVLKRSFEPVRTIVRERGYKVLHGVKRKT